MKRPKLENINNLLYMEKLSVTNNKIIEMLRIKAFARKCLEKYVFSSTNYFTTSKNG